MNNIFLILSTILPLVAPIFYSRAILKGDAKPHRTTRLILLFVGSIAVASLFAQNDRVAIWLATASALQALIIFILSIKYGMGGWAKIDILCLIIALIGIIAWQTTKEPVLALYFSLLADFTGMIPAIIKTYHRPETEIWSFFLIDAFGSIFNLLALRSWSINQSAYPVYLLGINLFMVLLIIRPKFTDDLKK